MPDAGAGGVGGADHIHEAFGSQLGVSHGHLV